MKIALALPIFLAALFEYSKQQVFPKNPANRLDEPVKFSCPEGQAIYHVESNYYRRMNDRVWSFSCRDLPFRNDTNKQAMTCEGPSLMINDYDGPLSYICTHTGALTGVMSKHDNAHEDRRWSFRCCSHDNYCRRDCFMTGEINDFRGPMNFTADAENFIVGLFSVHDNSYEDRRWNLEVCRIARCGL